MLLNPLGYMYVFGNCYGVPRYNYLIRCIAIACYELTVILLSKKTRSRYWNRKSMNADEFENWWSTTGKPISDQMGLR